MPRCQNLEGVKHHMKTYEANILFTSSGRRVSLLNMFKEYLGSENITGRIITADFKNNAPTTFVSDQHYVVPRVSDENYVNELVAICIKENIKLIIPLIDTELPLLAEKRSTFEELGIKVLISGSEVIRIGCDKVDTYTFFKENGIPTPRVYGDHETDYQFPLIVKPRDGSSGLGVTVVNNLHELEFFKTYIKNSMIQDMVRGEEYTVDVMVDFDGNIKTIVPRQRIEIRAGEVSKGITRKDPTIISAVKDVMKKLVGAVGCINLQCFKKENGEISFIEINPRFGGGVPLAIKAGANFPKWTVELMLGMAFVTADFSWLDGLTMLRYDDAIFTEQLTHVD
jgi:carbamoyl-phosphate synthase large subunit